MNAEPKQWKFKFEGTSIAPELDRLGEFVGSYQGIEISLLFNDGTVLEGELLQGTSGDLIILWGKDAGRSVEIPSDQIRTLGHSWTPTQTACEAAVA